MIPLRKKPAGARQRLARALVSTLLFAAGTCIALGARADLPPGRTWSTRDTLRLPGHTRGFGPYVLWHESGDSLSLVGRALGGIGEDLYGLVWRDSAWVPRWSLGSGIATAEPGTSTEGRRPLVWRPLDFVGRLVYSEDRGEVLAPSETVSTLNWISTVEYAAAASPQRRWVSVHDVPDGLRLFYSDTVGAWHEATVSGEAPWGTSLVSLNDSTVMVAAGQGVEPRLLIGVLSGTSWSVLPSPETFGLFVVRPRLRSRPSGGISCFWATDDAFIAVSSFNGNSWSPTQQIPFHFEGGGQAFSRECKVSYDGGERPVIAFGADNAIRFGATPFVAIPWASGYLEPEELKTTEDLQILCATPDWNGDVWVGWWGSSRGMIWTHTYPQAVPRTPRVVLAGDNRVVRWEVSETSPKAWWGVLRAEANGPFKLVARVQSDDDTLMSWMDAQPPAGILRYRIRREHVDARYRVESEAAQWPSGAQAPLRWHRVPIPAADSATIELIGAAPGTVRLALHDLLGRVVSRAERQASGTGRDSFAISFIADQRALPAGVYFLRAVDASGVASEAAKLVVLR